MATKKNGKLSVKAFTIKAIPALRSDGYKGCHTVYSGFNAAFKEYFEGQNPIDATTAMFKAGDIFMHPTRGGAMIYLPEEAPKNGNNGAGKAALGKMGL